MSAANYGGPNRVIREDQLDAAYSSSMLPLRGGKGWLYEGGLRVPMIVKAPGVKSGVCDQPVVSVDFIQRCSVLPEHRFPAIPRPKAWIFRRCSRRKDAGSPDLLALPALQQSWVAEPRRSCSLRRLQIDRIL